MAWQKSQLQKLLPLKGTNKRELQCPLSTAQMKCNSEILSVSYSYDLFELSLFLILQKPKKFLLYSILFYSKPSVPVDKWSGQSGYANWCLLLCFLPLFSKVQLHSSTAIHHWNEARCGAKLNVPISISQREAVQGTEVTVVEIG